MKHYINITIILTFTLNIFAQDVDTILLRPKNYQLISIGSGIYIKESDKVWRSRYENNVIESEGKFKPNWKLRRTRQHGIWKYYSQEGILIKEEEYKKGKLINVIKYTD